MASEPNVYERTRGKITLRSLRDSKPKSKTGQIRFMLSDIEAALRTGHSVKEVWAVAVENGLNTTYKQFSSYLARVRRRERPQRGPAKPSLDHNASSRTPDNLDAQAAHDPFANLRSEREKHAKRGFHFDPFSVDKDLI